MGDVGQQTQSTTGDAMELVLLWILFAVFSGVIANAKKREVFLWVLVGLFFGPFGLIVGFLPPKEDDLRKASNQQNTRCKKCQELIKFNAKVCRHCGAHFPYLSEPARSHVELIEQYYVKGDSPAAIAEALNSKGIQPATKKSSWVEADISQIIVVHIS
jgi:hypothetical protein